MYDKPPDHRKRRAIILNTDEEENPTAKINSNRNTRVEEPAKEEEHNSTEFKTRLVKKWRISNEKCKTTLEKVGKQY
eukprot:8798040-Ditylum_brightwellii.AAC.1